MRLQKFINALNTEETFSLYWGEAKEAVNRSYFHIGVSENRECIVASFAVTHPLDNYCRRVGSEISLERLTRAIETETLGEDDLVFWYTKEDIIDALLVHNGFVGSNDLTILGESSRYDRAYDAMVVFYDKCWSLDPRAIITFVTNNFLAEQRIKKLITVLNKQVGWVENA